MAINTNYVVRGPTEVATNGDLYSTITFSVSLTASDWAPSADPARNGGAGDTVRCPRAFIPAADGTLAIQAIGDSAVQSPYVLKGLIYPIAIKAIDQSACSAALQIANAVTLLY